MSATRPVPEPKPNGRPEPAIERLTYRLGDLPEAFGVSRRTIERARSAGRFPAPDLRIGKAPLWSRDTLVRWIAGGGAPR